jgi:hypothetical protein
VLAFATFCLYAGELPSVSRQPFFSKAGIAWRSAKEENLLARGSDSIADYIGESFSKPRTASEHELIGRQFRSIRKPEALRRFSAGATQ